MNGRKGFLLPIAISLLIAAPLVANADKEPSSNHATTVVTTGAPPPPALSIGDLLPEKLAGASATSEIKQYKPEALGELAAEQAASYQEYRITLAASRLYNTTRIDVFKTETPHAAFGLFTYMAKEADG